MRAKAKYVIIGLAVLLIAMLEWQRQMTGRSMSDEQYAFLELRELARGMIAERALGVLTNANGSFIGSFDDFFAYVARNKPGWASDKDAANPFPGLLRGQKYGRSQSIALDGAGLLFWSETIYDRPDGRVQFSLTRNGEMTIWAKIKSRAPATSGSGS